MIIRLYKNTSDTNVVNKTLTNVIELSDASIRGSVDVLNPVIRIVSTADLPKYNYCYLPAYGRYYFITDITEYRTDCFDITLKVDVLETYKASFLPLEAVIGRQEKQYNLYLNDDKWSVYANRQVLTREFPNGFLNQGQYYLTMAGGNN